MAELCIISGKNCNSPKSWNPLNPKELLKLLDNENLRSINNENELVNVILESLEKLEVRMHGITPSVEFVWNEKPLIPKAESHLSNFIKTHLQEDLSNTIINREVEIRPTMGSSSGENTDILVQTFFR
ncbi:MAG: hypothetical protein H6613_16460 [Ignavibacteriales bacterium]|nr:hypothetical protein [Ignavibacteriales bacterium]